MIKKANLKEIKIKRAFDPPENSDGMRILVDRNWPRGLSRQKACVDYWTKDIAPSTALRKWYQHDVKKWNEFKNRYFAELDNNQPAFNQFIKSLNNNATLLFDSREIKLNNAYALKAYLVSYQESLDS